MTAARYAHAHDLTLGSLGFGCASLLRITSDAERQRLLGAALDAGFTHFDVARLYGLGQAESQLGKFARGRRDQLTIATKFGLDPAGKLGALARFQQPARALLNRYPALRNAVKKRDQAMIAPRRYDAAHAQRSLDTSLQQLGVDHVDILFVHDPAPHDTIAYEELVAFFDAQRAAGKVLAWGVSQDAHPGVDFLSGLGPHALLQVRTDAVTPAKVPAEPYLSFGVFAGAYARIQAALADSATRTEWAQWLGADPLEGDLLTRLLLADAAARNPEGTILYSTNRPERLPGAAEALTTPADSEQLAAFQRLATGLAGEERS